MHVSIPPSSSIINKTHAELSAMATAGTLEPGQLYWITDFRTKHLIPNTTVYNTGPTEPLIVTAVSENKIDKVAVSETYPQDIIYYEVTDAAWGGDKGRIYYREDTTKGVTAWEDWRNNKYRRWETSPESGIYTVLTDNGGNYVDRYVFNNSATADGCFSVKIGPRSSTAMPNNVFAGSSEHLDLGTDCYDNTSLSLLGYCQALNDFARNVFKDAGAVNNIFGTSFYNNVVENDFAYNILNDFGGNTVEAGFRRNVVQDMSGVTLSGNLEERTHAGGFSNFETSVDITGLTTFDITVANSYAGIVDATSTNATETINLISNQPDWNYYEIKPASNLTLTLTGTAYAAINANGQILLGAATRVLNGAKRDSIKLRKETITNGNGTFAVAREVGVNISL